MKRTGIFHMCRCLLKGQSIARVLLNRAFVEETLRGRVIDVGGGRNPDYVEYFKKEEGMRIEAIDGQISGINFEHDPLPVGTGEADTIILANVLEHVFNYHFLLSETHRVLRPGGQLVGFVPFWVGYHPDPNDYFRYTKEALLRILTNAGFSDIQITPLRTSPVLSNLNSVILSLPRVLRPACYLACLPLEIAYLRARPQSVARQPLGFIFTAYHHA
jgi:SAM-dependent methyltransferase